MAPFIYTVILPQFLIGEMCDRGCVHSFTVFIYSRSSVTIDGFSNAMHCFREKEIHRLSASLYNRGSILKPALYGMFFMHL